jgi:hypothetical protein
MRLTWRDGLTAVLAVVVAVVAVAVLQQWGWPLLGSYRAGMVALGVIGLAMCGVGGYQFWNTAFDRPGSIMKDAFLIVGLVLGVAATTVLVIGLTTGTQAPFVWMVAVIGVLWVVATARHAVEEVPRGTHPAMGAA